MDAHHFDHLAKQIGTRRTALGGLIAGLFLPMEAAARGKKGKNRDREQGKGKGKRANKIRKRATVQADTCWRAGACIPKRGSNVSQCDLSGYMAPSILDCTGCNLSRANLSGATFAGTTFTRANLSGACLIDADFSGATFANNTNLSNAIFCNTTMPDGSVNNSRCTSGTACCGTCAPTTCAAQGKTCGQISDGCGNTLDCGTCTGSDICCNNVCCDGCCGANGNCGACRVFITSSTHTGNLGGLDGADEICNGLARNASSPLPGTYKAWLSIDNTPNQSPANGRFRRSGKPYQLVNGTQIAANWADLTDGNIAAPINQTESGATFSTTQVTYTNTRTDGSAGDLVGNIRNCQQWQSGSAADNGNTGGTDDSGNPARWTQLGFAPCLNQFGPDRRLYCFQQQ